MNNLRISPLSSCKNLPPYFFMVYLLHHLYGVDAPARYRPHRDITGVKEIPHNETQSMTDGDNARHV